MAMLNIPSTCDDPSYRYKMPRLLAQKEGSGNGKMTCIVNAGDVAHALQRPPQYITKWFGIELCAQSKYTNKKGEGERAIIHGHHDAAVLQEVLDKFIHKYVLCQRCDLPELHMNTKKGIVCGQCAACGWKGQLDNRHKLRAFITKNPPDNSGVASKSERIDQCRKDGDKTDRVESRESAAGNGERRKAEDKQQKITHNGKLEDVGKDGDPKHYKGPLTFNDGDTIRIISNLKEFYENRSADDLFTEVRIHQIAKGFDHKLRLFIVLQILADDTYIDKAKLLEHREVINRYVTEPRLKTFEILWAFDAHCHVLPSAFKGFPHCLKVLYDEDWIEESDVLAYYNQTENVGQPGFEKAREAAKPFLTWLETASETSASED